MYTKDISIWLYIYFHADPMWYKYPHLSPYAYCADNPMRFIAPDGLDVFMGGMSFVPVAGIGISLYWSLGGKKLHYMYVNKVLIPQIQMGINPGLCVYQPFK